MTNGGGPAYLTNERESELDRDSSLICPTEENGQTENIRKISRNRTQLNAKIEENKLKFREPRLRILAVSQSNFHDKFQCQFSCQSHFSHPTD